MPQTNNNNIDNFTRDIEDRIDSILKSESDGYHLYLVKDGTVTAAYKLQFRDTGIYLNSSADGQLDIVADTEIQIAAPLVDLNGNLDVSGTSALGDTATIATDKKLQFRDTGIYISSKADTFLDLDADGAVRINSVLIFQSSVNYGVTTNTGNNYSLAVGIGNLTDGQTVTFKANAASTGTVSLNVNAKGAKNLYLADQITQVTTELVQNNQYQAIYNSSLATGSGGWWIVNL